MARTVNNHKECCYTYNTAQLNFIDVCGYTCALAQFMQIKFMMWYVCSLLHTDLLCTLVQLNTQGTLDTYKPHKQTHQTYIQLTVKTCDTSHKQL